MGAGWNKFSSVRLRRHHLVLTQPSQAVSGFRLGIGPLRHTGNSELPDGKARDAYQANTGGSTVNLRDPDGFFVQISSKDGR